VTHLPYSKKEKKKTNKQLDKIAKKKNLKIGRVKLQEQKKKEEELE